MYERAAEDGPVIVPGARGGTGCPVPSFGQEDLRNLSRKMMKRDQAISQQGYCEADDRRGLVAGEPRGTGQGGPSRGEQS